MTVSEKATTMCEDCGRSLIPSNEAVWTDDGASFCPACRPGIAASARADVPVAALETAKAAILNAFDLEHPDLDDLPEDEQKSGFAELLARAAVAALVSAPAQEGMVLVPREPSRKQIERLAHQWGYTIEEAVEVYAVILDVAAPASPEQGGE